MNATYQLSRSSWIIVLLAAVMAAGFAACYILGDPAEFGAFSPGRQIFLQALLGCVIAFLVFSGIALALGILRHRLRVSEDHVELVGILRTRRIALDEVVSARWRQYSDAGRLVLRTSSEKVGITFSNYRKPQARELVRFFRNRLPRKIQQGWENYWKQYWRLFDQPDPARREQFAEETRKLRRRLHILMALSTLVIVPAGVFVWQYTGDREVLAFVLMALLIRPLVAWAKADRGRVAASFPLQPKADGLMLAALVFFAVAWTLPLVLAVFNLPHGAPIFFVGNLVSFALFVPGVVSQTRRIERVKAEAAQVAEKEYLSSPSETASQPPQVSPETPENR